MKFQWVLGLVALVTFLAMGVARAQETTPPVLPPEGMVPPPTAGEAPQPTGEVGLGEDESLLGSRLLEERVNQVFSLQQVTMLTLQNNLQVKINRINPHLSEADIETAEAVFDTTLSGAIRGSHQESPTFTDFAGLVSSDVDAVQASVGLKKQFTTGATGSVSLSGANSESEDSRPSLDSNLAFSVTQPLLQGAGRDVNLADVHIAQNNTRISRWEFKNRVISTLADSQTTYWSLVFALENLEVQKKSWRLSKNTLAQTRAQVEAGLLAKIEITRVRADVASKEERIITAQRVVQDAEDQLRRFINEEGSKLTEDIGIVPLDRATYTPVVLDLSQEIATALANRPDYVQAKIDIENRDIILVVAGNVKLPQLDLTATFDINGLGHNLPDSLSALSDVEFTDWSASASLSYPLGNRAANASYLRARLNKVQSLLRLKNLEDQIVIDVKQAVRLVNTDLKRIPSTRLARELAEERLVAEEAKLNVGTAIILDVLDAQTRLAEAQSAERRAIVDYNQDLIQLEKVKGTLLGANRIYLPEESQRAGR